MAFSSLVFVCIFMPIVFLLHSVLRPIRLKNALLIAASLLFYAFGEPVYVFLMLLSALFNYVCGLLVSGRGKKLWLALAVAVNVGVLCVFKYAGFFVETLDRLTGLSLPVPQIALPIGISFFTFQALSYVIDVYRGQTERQKSFARLLLYISFFPQLIAGPIVKYRDVAAEIEPSACGASSGASARRSSWPTRWPSRRISSSRWTGARSTSCSPGSAPWPI